MQNRSPRCHGATATPSSYLPRTPTRRSGQENVPVWKVQLRPLEQTRCVRLGLPQRLFLTQICHRPIPTRLSRLSSQTSSALPNSTHPSRLRHPPRPPHSLSNRPRPAGAHPSSNSSAIATPTPRPPPLPHPSPRLTRRTSSSQQRSLPRKLTRSKGRYSVSG
jgi:hypothetical protein